MLTVTGARVCHATNMTQRTPLLVAPLLLLTLLLVACAPSSTIVLDVPPPLPEHRAVWATAGGSETRSERGELRSQHGCTVRFERHEPVGERAPREVVLAHGFLRNEASMRGWAEHFASHGVATTVVRFCNSTPLNGHHDRNADDLRAVADAVAPERGRIYAGFSAGGLAALLASAADPLALGLLALDAVDSGGLAQGVQALTLPALVLLAEPAACNAEGNFEEVRARLPNATWTRVPAATHCHFESPYDARCEVLCGRVAPPEAAAAIRGAIVALATEFVAATARQP